VPTRAMSLLPHNSTEKLCRARTRRVALKDRTHQGIPRCHSTDTWMGDFNRTDGTFLGAGSNFVFRDSVHWASGLQVHKTQAKLLEIWISEIHKSA
jgi:hypothetical protein